MESEATDQIAARRLKLEALRAAGENPYGNDFRPTHTTAAVLAEFGRASAEELSASAPRVSVAVAGRMVGKRDFGRASFLHLLDREGTLQVYVKRDELGDDGFARFRQRGRRRHRRGRRRAVSHQDRRADDRRAGVSRARPRRCGRCRRSGTA